MDQGMLTAIIGILALGIGIGLGKVIFAKNTKLKIEEAENQARKLVADAQTNAETIKQQKQLEAKEKFLALRAEYDKEVTGAQPQTGRNREPRPSERTKHQCQKRPAG